MGMPEMPTARERAGCVIRSIMWRTVLRITTKGFKITGNRNPGEQCLIIANHSSHADTPALLAALGTKTFPLAVAAHDYWFTKAWRRIFFQTFVGGYPVRRSGGGYGDLLRAQSVFRRGRSLIMYPEGTRTNKELGRFHNGPFRLAGEVGIPLLPVAIIGTDEFLPPGKWRPTRTHIEVRIGKPVHITTPAEARDAITELLSHSTESPDRRGRMSRLGAIWQRRKGRSG